MDEQEAKADYVRHNQEVLEHVPPSKVNKQQPHSTLRVATSSSSGGGRRVSSATRTSTQYGRHARSIFQVCRICLTQRRSGGSTVTWSTDFSRTNSRLRCRRDTYSVDATLSSYLEFSVKQGWEPLCRFLEIPVPDEPFPRVNSTARDDEGSQEVGPGDLDPPPPPVECTSFFVHTGER